MVKIDTFIGHVDSLFTDNNELSMVLTTCTSHHLLLDKKSLISFDILLENTCFVGYHYILLYSQQIKVETLILSASLVHILPPKGSPLLIYFY